MLESLPQIVRLLVAMGIVLVMMGGLAYCLKRLGLGDAAPKDSNKTKRLHLIESLPLDARRRAVLLRCDESEHLVILGANGETVIKTDIKLTKSKS